MTIRRILVVGGGSAGFLAAITLKARIRDLAVCVIRSKEIGIIGVGEGSTVVLPQHLHGYLGIDYREFYELADPIWKLGIRFLWGPRPEFHYTFAPNVAARYGGLRKTAGYYVAPGPMEYTSIESGLMTQNKAFARLPDGRPDINTGLAYHLENENFVTFLEQYALRLGVEIVDDTITEVQQGDHGITGLRLASGAVQQGDLYVDCSGFFSLLLSKTLNEPFVSFKSSLFCDRAVVGGWPRQEEPIKPYTTAETMNSGWCWQIEHEHRINRGYVYSSAFISDEEAEREFRAQNPKVVATRVVKFVTGRYERSWVKNVVAIGNASGFVEPLESTSLAFICREALYLAEGLVDADRELRPTVRNLFNRRVSKGWDVIRQFLAMHYRFNTRLQTPFWRECVEKADLASAAEIVEFYRENGPSALWERTLLDPDDQFQIEGYWTMLVGQQVPYRTGFVPTDAERRTWEQIRGYFRRQADNAYSVNEALALVRSPDWKWPDLYPRVCAPAPPRSSQRAVGVA